MPLYLYYIDTHNYDYNDNHRNNANNKTAVISTIMNMIITMFPEHHEAWACCTDEMDNLL